MAALLGVPVPAGNLGSVLPHLFEPRDYLRAISANGYAHSSKVFCQC
jgi:hypothetical protein